jgi:catechol 2,3-dioxygenase-like lactoylglutathione lyase family enzyme
VHHDRVREPGNVDPLWIRVADRAAAQRFYETIAPYAGFELANARERSHFVGAGGSFTLLEGAPTEHVHLAFPAADDATVDAFHRAATEAGYRDNGAPGERPVYHPGYYGAYVLDPDGNNVEVVNHNR